MEDPVRMMARDKARTYSDDIKRRSAFVRGWMRSWEDGGYHAEEAEQDAIPAAWATGYLAGTEQRHALRVATITAVQNYWQRQEA